MLSNQLLSMQWINSTQGHKSGVETKASQPSHMMMRKIRSAEKNGAHQMVGVIQRLGFGPISIPWPDYLEYTASAESISLLLTPALLNIVAYAERNRESIPSSMSRVWNVFQIHQNCNVLQWDYKSFAAMKYFSAAHSNSWGCVETNVRNHLARSKKGFFFISYLQDKLKTSLMTHVLEFVE